MRRVVIFSAMLAACAPPEAEIAATSAAATAEVPVLTFAADWSETQSGPLVAGSPAKIRFALERLPQCRAIYHGGPAWGITANWTAEDGYARSAGVTRYEGGVNVAVDVDLLVPFGRELSVWFFNSDV